MVFYAVEVFLCGVMGLLARPGNEAILSSQTPTSMKFIQIKETCIYFRDLALARSFYHEKLGLPIISFVPGKHIFFRAGSSVLLCFNPDDSRAKTSPPPHFSEGKYHFA